MKALTNLEKNLFNQTTTQEINRVAVCRAFLSDDQTQQLFKNQGCIRFVSNALLGVVQLLNKNLVDPKLEQDLIQKALDKPNDFYESELYYISILDKIKNQIEAVKDRIREQDNEEEQELNQKLKTAKSEELIKIEKDLDKLNKKRQKQEELWKSHPVLLDKRLFNKLLLWLKDGFPFLHEADSQALIRATYDVLASLIRFVNGRGKVGYPHFKRKGESSRLNFARAKVNLERGIIKLSKMDAFRIRKKSIKKWIKNPLHSENLIKREIISVDMVYENRKWLCHILIQDTLKQEPSLEKVLGIDRGVRNLVAISKAINEMQLFNFSDKVKSKLERLDKRIKRIQQLLSKTQKGKNRQKLRLKKQRLHRKVKMIKLDWQRKLAHTLVVIEKFHHIALEDLSIKNMTKSAKGTKEKPGKNVKAKSGLNRSILEQAWYQFELLLRNKLEEVGGTLVKVNPAYTSQCCHKCGHTQAENRQDEKFQCVKCGHKDHADINAAKNIGQRYQAERKLKIQELTKLGMTPPNPKSS